MSDPRYLDAGKVWTSDGRLVPMPSGGSDPNRTYTGRRPADVGGPVAVPAEIPAAGNATKLRGSW
jgi:hypothetical protein